MTGGVQFVPPLRLEAATAGGRQKAYHRPKSNFVKQ